MNQEKIGKFIAQCRKDCGLTQMELSEQLNVTDRAVSKWERGKSMPDSSIMLNLCSVLNITVNELLCGEKILMDDNKKLEQTLLDVIKEKEQADKRLLSLEILMGTICIIFLLALTMIASYIQMTEALRITLIIIGIVPFLIACPFMLKIEQVAGYYECKECKHRYVPTYKAVNLAPHMGRTRYMRCPKCHKKSWNKKVISKEL